MQLPGSSTPSSIRTRLLGAILALLLLFFGVIAFVLVQAFRHSAEEALGERLLSEIYGLLAAAEVTPSGQIQFPEQFPQFRFMQPDSGLVGEVFSADGSSIWRSVSMADRQLPLPPELASGTSAVDLADLLDETWIRARLAVRWELDDEQFFLLQFAVAENASGLQTEIREFRNLVLKWLAFATVLLLITGGLVMHWGLLPLGRAAREVDQIKAGRRQNLGDNHPRELLPLTQSLNSLLDQQGANLERHRNALADAAHSIKTPLAALKNSLANEADNLQQLNRIDQIVEYHLKKAATAGPTALKAPLLIEPLVQQLINSLQKVYADRELSFAVDIQAGCQFPGDQGDFLELLGNLLDNACKWGGRQVGCSITEKEEAGTQFLRIEVTDDGPGVAPNLYERIMQRGVQLDERLSGQGIGLAVVQGILDSYKGILEINPLSPTGTLFLIQIPKDLNSLLTNFRLGN